MRISAMEAAQEFVEKQFPNYLTAILADSASRGEETDTSDLDIVIFTDNESYRESLVDYGWRIESFVHNKASYLEKFESERRVGRVILATMIFTGVVLKDTGLAKSIEESAADWIEQGPPALTESFINSSRYFITISLTIFEMPRVRQRQSLR